MSHDTSEPLRDWRGIIAKAQEISRKRMRRVAVAAAEDSAVLQAVVEAKAQGIADAILVGNREKINRLAEQLKQLCARIEKLEAAKDNKK